MINPRARAVSAPPRWPRWWADDAWLAIAAPVLIFIGFALFGAMLPQTALSLTCMWAGILGVCLVRPRLNREFSRLEGLALPCVLFATVILVALWSLTPYVPGGPHPVWAYLKISPGAATIDRSLTQLEILKLLGLGCVFVVGAIIGGSNQRARLAVHTTLALGAAYATWAFFDFVTTRGPGGTRLEASFMSANTAGTVCAVLLVLAIGPLASSLRAPSRQRLIRATPFAIAALIFLVSPFATATRGAFISAGAGLATFGLLQVFASRARLSRVAIAGGLAVVVVFGLLAIAGDLLLTRLVGSSQDVASRADIAAVHWKAAQTSPLMGFGLGSFDPLNRTLLDSANFQHLWSVRAAHNIYLTWLAQAGLLGAAPMAACLVVLLARTVRNAARRSRGINLVYALVASCIVFLAHGVTDFALEMFAVAAFFSFLLGLQFARAQGSAAR